jgi:citrate synthase
VVHLRHRGKAPNEAKLAAMTATLRQHRSMSPEVRQFVTRLPKDASHMNVIRTGVSLLGVFDRRGRDQDRALNEERALSICAKIPQIPLIIAAFHCHREGRKLPEIRTDLSGAASFLWLITDKEPGVEATKTLDVAYILHANHGMNASTFSARVTVATLSDMYSVITSAIGTLKGPLHGGADAGVMHMLQEIGDEDKVDAWVEEKLTKKEQIMPRAPHLQKMAMHLTQELGEPKWIRMSERTATIMRERKKLNANVDFYRATVYYSLGIPMDLFTPIFATSRAAGWTAQVLEQLEDNRLYRPLTEYTGLVPPQPILPIAQRA